MFNFKLTAAILFSAAMCLSSGASAAPDGKAGGSSVYELSFADARSLMHANSSAVKMKDYDVANAKGRADAAKSMSGPKITLSAMQVEGSKTVDMDVSGLLPALPPQLPIKLPTSIGFKEDIGGPRASINLIWPLYTGGAISAQQDALAFKVDEAEHAKKAYLDAVDVDLAVQYWGLELARNVVALRKAALEDEEEALQQAKAFEEKGLISRIERMAVEVSRDAARREHLAAQTELDVAAATLARTLRSSSNVKLTTPLFVLKDEIGTLDSWKDKALARSPVLSQVESVKSQAQAGVKAAQGAYHPQVFAFGQKNLIKHYLTLPEPDWIAGVGVNITLWDNKDRASSVAAARALEDKAASAADEARNSVLKAVEVAFLKTTQARQSWELTASTLALARENLRLRQASFKEGLSTAIDLNTARTQFVAAQIAEQAAAYRFVAGWANLAAAAGSFDEFIASLSSPGCEYITVSADEF